MQVVKSMIAVLMVVSLAACAADDKNQKQTGGNLLGGGLGALLGSQLGGGKGKLAVVAIGALAGAYAGSEIGKSLDKADLAYLNRTTQDALEYNKVNQSSAWNNPDSKNSGTVTPTKTYQTAEGRNCREYETTIVIDGKTEKATGTACRQPDGSWRIVN
ncbi:MAG: RT0821/Lpp0805 family surface protein [Rhodospirillaceae bacterium]